MPSNWGEIADLDLEDDYEPQEDAGDLLPVPSSTIDCNGVKTSVVYKRNDEGDIIKTVRKTRNKMVRQRISLNALARRKRVVKFGACAGKKGPEKGITFPSYTEIEFEFNTLAGQTADQDVDNEEEKAMQKEMQSLTRKLEGRTLLVGASARERLGAWNKRNKEGLGVTTTDAPAPVASGYRPPAMRGARAGGSGGGGSRYDDDDEPTVRITNLTEEATYEDLKALVGQFRPLKVRLAKDRYTQRSRGFAFISFASRRSAQECMDRLHGHGYGHLILSVEWAKSFKSVAGKSGGGR